MRAVPLGLLMGSLIATGTVAQPSGGFGLDALLGVSPGMPLEEAVALIEARGYEIPQGGSRELVEMLRNQRQPIPFEIHGNAGLGLTVHSAAMRVDGMTVPVEAAFVVLRRVEDDVLLEAELEAEWRPSPDGEGYGMGQVYRITLTQDHSRVRGAVDLPAILGRLLAAAAVPPSCEEEVEVHLTWLLDEEGDVVAPPGPPELCGERATTYFWNQPMRYQILEDLEGQGGRRPPEADSLEIRVFDSNGGMVYLQRRDSLLERRIAEEAIARGLEGGSAVVDF